MRKALALLVIPAALLALAGCSSTNSESINHDQQTSNTILDRYQKNQPIPQFDWSQYRQTLIDVETAQANGVATTTFFYNLGSGTPIKSCPSIGFPVASTAQLSNPDQVVSNPQTSGSSVISQLEPNGVYTGGSSGTYVVCVTPSGAKAIDYWEGDVETEGGPAHWDATKGQIVLDGAPTVKSTDKK